MMGDVDVDVDDVDDVDDDDDDDDDNYCCVFSLMSERLCVFCF